VPEGLEGWGSPFGTAVLALAPYPRFTHAIGCGRLTRLFAHLFALCAPSCWPDGGSS
jgi:hypothetical protein